MNFIEKSAIMTGEYWLRVLPNYTQLRPVIVPWSIVYRARLGA